MLHILLGLTPMERWAAARRMNPHSLPQPWFVPIGIALLLVLLVLLLAISLRRHQQNQGQRAQKFDAEARRRGLTVRECHILLAIAVRSGLRRTLSVFHTVDAFHRGAVQLLAECAQTRTQQENGELKAEVLRLRQKLGFQTLNHSEEIDLINRRRFPRVSLRAPALVASLPFIQRDGAAGEPSTPYGLHASMRLVEGTVTEFAGPGLRIETRLPVHVDDRVLVLWRLASEGGSGTLAAIGRVKHGRDTERGAGIPDAIDRVWEGTPARDPQALAPQPLSIAVELTGLRDEEIDELAMIVSELSSPGQDIGGDRAVGPQELPAYATT